MKHAPAADEPCPPPRALLLASDRRTARPPDRWSGRARWIASCLSSCLALALSACGGGGDDGSVAEPVVEAVSQTIAGEAVTPVGEANCGEAAMQSEATVRLSLLRAQRQVCGSRGSFAPAGLVRWSTQLYEAAQVHSLDMANRAYFEHNGPSGDSPAQRVRETGYRYVRVAENIARGRSGPTGGPLDTAAALQLWKDSPSHCANLMDAGITEIGLACVVNRSKVRYWTLVLARPAS